MIWGIEKRGLGGLIIWSWGTEKIVSRDQTVGLEGPNISLEGPKIWSGGAEQIGLEERKMGSGGSKKRLEGPKQ